MDCKVWLAFLDKSENPRICRAFIDFFSQTENTYVLTDFCSDASRAKTLGMDAVFNNHWLFGLWPEGFIKKQEPSTEFLELFTLTAALVAWQQDGKLSNKRVILFCDNQTVMHMINKSSSVCEQCMKLIRILTLSNIRYNRRILVKFIRSKEKILADALSRNDFKCFWEKAPKTMTKIATPLPDWMWLIDKIWCDNKGNYLQNL